MLNQLIKFIKGNMYWRMITCDLQPRWGWVDF